MTTNVADSWWRSREESAPRHLRVSQWSLKDSHGDRLVSRALADVVMEFNRLMRPPRQKHDLRPTPAAAIGGVSLLAKTMGEETVPPTLVPRFGGGIQMEWHMNGVDLEISVEADGSASVWCEHASGREWDDSESPNIERLKKELSLLVKYE
jgi:hypothetical protein